MTLDSALLLYKGTILPILEYANFVHDFNIKYINKKTTDNTEYGAIYSLQSTLFIVRIKRIH